MKDQNVYTLINEQNGDLAFKLFSFTDNSHFDHLQRNNFYALIWIQQGSGVLKVDFSEYSFTSNTLFTFAPYQPFMFSTTTEIQGIALYFHSDFYCIHRNPKETHCDTVLFNNIYKAPFFEMDSDLQETFTIGIRQMISEFDVYGTDHYELFVPMLKILLTNATRSKLTHVDRTPQFTSSQMPAILQQLKDTIEMHFRETHSPSDYATMLHISPNALAKLVKSHYHKTLRDLITERILIEAKRELYMTTKPIKEIAWDLGYTDEFYFSRFFKTHTQASPQHYRTTVGFGKAEQ